MGDACFSPASLALLGLIAAPIAAGFSKLYLDGMKSRDAQIADLSARLTRATGRLRTGVAVMDEAETELRSRAGGRR